MWTGVLAWLRLVVYCKLSPYPPSGYGKRSLIHFLDVASLPSSDRRGCNILPDEPCEYLNRDSFTVLLAAWISIHMIWVTMLLVTQLFLIARGQTTWESMRGSSHRLSHTAATVTSAVTAGSTSLEAAGLDAAAPPPTAVSQQGRRRDGWFASVKKLFGLDTFMNTASGKAAQKSNPFSRGSVANCRDFWCDPAPIFKMRENGAAMLDGEIVNYTMMYDPPARTRIGREINRDGATYQSVGDDENV